MKPELLAIRTVNEYKRYNKLAYLGIRYYLVNQCARRDRWVGDVSTRLVLTRTQPNYFKILHFKEANEQKIKHRAIYLPSPNEALAEAALINECSKYDAFKSLSCVYSYRFPKNDSNEGIYQKYFSGLKERHKSLAKFCKESNKSTIKCTDIKKFYPHITKEIALKSWQNACNESKIENKYRELGEKILEDHAQISSTSGDKGLLTGSMISHLVANLLLKDLDKKMSKTMPNKYWRYVDDIFIGGTKQEVMQARSLLENLLIEKGLELHDGDKDFSVTCLDWLKGENDFKTTNANQLWWNFTNNIKNFLIVYPNQREKLAQAFLEQHININLLDYSSIAKEHNTLENFIFWFKRYNNKWARKIINSLSINSLIIEANNVKNSLNKEITGLLEIRSADIHERKRLITKIRHSVGHLIYLATPGELHLLSNRLSSYQELYMLSKIFDSIASRDVSELVGLGVNATQVAAQVLRLQNTPVKCFLDDFGEAGNQGIAILNLNGIKIDKIKKLETPFNSFALEEDMKILMKSSDLFIKELACLHGLEQEKRHLSLLDSAFYKDEDLSFEIENLLLNSY